MRMFIGFKLSEASKNKIKKILTILEVEGRFTAPDNLHLTLVFLGELNIQEIEKVKKILNNINLPAFTFETSKIEMLRDIAILKVENNESLQKLYGEVFNKLNQEGFPLRKRKYFPHITIIRNCKRVINTNFTIYEEVDEIVLFSSERIDKKLTYIPRYLKRLKKHIDY